MIENKPDIQRAFFFRHSYKFAIFTVLIVLLIILSIPEKELWQISKLENNKKPFSVLTDSGQGGSNTLTDSGFKKDVQLSLATHNLSANNTEPKAVNAPPPSARHLAVETQADKQWNPEHHTAGSTIDIESESIGGTTPAPEEKNAEHPKLPISGRVITKDGEAVPGISVIAVTRQLFQKQENSNLNIQEQQTNTDQNGNYYFPQLADGEYQIRTKSTEQYPSATIQVRTGVEAADIVLINAHDLRVYGIATNSQGKPLDAVRVIPAGQKKTTTTDSEGSYEISLSVTKQDGDLAFRFIKDGYRTETLSLHKSDANTNRDFQLNAELKPIGQLVTIIGNVTNTAGAPIHKAKVQINSSHLKRRFQAISDRNGNFLMADVEVADDYQLWVRPKSGYKNYIEDLEVSGSNQNLAIILQSNGKEDLSGKMVDSDGNPISQFSLWLQSSNAGSIQSTVTSDQQGLFNVKDIPEGELSFQTRSSPYFSVSGIKHLVDKTATVKVTLDWGENEIFGRVVDSGDTPIPGANVSLYWSHEENGVLSRSKRGTSSGSNGDFLFTQLGAGEHLLNVSMPGYRSMRLYRHSGIGEKTTLVKLESFSP